MIRWFREFKVWRLVEQEKREQVLTDWVAVKIQEAVKGIGMPHYVAESIIDRVRTHDLKKRTGRLLR